MSSVTSLFLFFACLEDEEERMAEVNSFFERTNEHLVLVDDEVYGWKGYGGTKRLEVNCAVAAINYLDLEGFISHLRTVKWEGPPDFLVQLCYRKDQAIAMKLVTIAPHEEG